MNTLIKPIISPCLLLLILVLSSACQKPNKPILAPGNGPIINPDPILTAQMVFDEAAKGPGKTDLPKLKDLYDKVIKDTTEANSLSELHDSANNYFIHKLLMLPTVDQTKHILSAWLNLLSNAPNAINHAGASQQPLAILTDSARAVADDQPDHRQEMINNLIDMGNAATIAAASADGTQTALLALLAKGDQALMIKVLDAANIADPASKKSLFNWVFNNRANFIAGSTTDSVYTAFTASQLKNSLRAQDLLDEAAIGPALAPAGTDLFKLKEFYTLVVKTDLDATALAALNPAPADGFINYLAKLSATTETKDIFVDYLTKIHTTGALAVEAELARVGSVALLTPFKEIVVGPRPLIGDVPGEHQEIIVAMAKYANAATVQLLTALELPVLYDAVLAEGDQVLLENMFKKTIAGQPAALITWAHTNQAATFNGVANTVKDALIAAAIITDQMVADEASKGPVGPGGTDLSKLKLLYGLAIDTDAKAAALATKSSTLPTLDLFANFLAKLIPHADILGIWTDYLAKIDADGATVAGGNAAAGIAAVTAQVGLVGAGDTPLTLVLKQADTADRNQIVKLMLSRDIAVIAATVAPAEVDELLTALRQVESQVNFLTAFTAILASQKAKALAWANTNKLATIDKEVGTPTIIAALQAGGTITDQMIVDEAALNTPAAIANLKFLYDMMIKNDATGAKAATLALQPPAVGGADLFVNFLAKLTPDNDILTLWTDYLTQIYAAGATAGGGNAAAGIAAVTTQVGLVGAGDTPLTLVLRQADTAHRNQIVKLMLSRDIAGIAATVAAAEVDELLAALRQEESQVNFLTAFNAVLGREKAKALAWANANQAQNITSSGTNIQTALAGSITPQMVYDETAAAVLDPSRIPFVKPLYDFAIKSDATGAQATALAVFGANPLDGFVNSLAKLPATTETKDIFVDYLTKIHATGTPAVEAELARVGAVALLTPFKQIVVGPRPLIGDVPGEHQEIIVAMAKYADATTTVKLLTAPELPVLYDAVLAKGDQALLEDMFKKTIAVQPAALKAWAHTNQATTFVTPALTASAVFTPQMLVDEVAKPGANTAELELIYNIVIKNNPANAAAISLLVDSAGKSFINLLAKLALDAKTKLMISDYLSQIKTAGDAVSHGLTAASAKDQARLVDAADLVNIFDAIKEHGSIALMAEAFKQDSAVVASLDATIAWAMNHRVDDIKASGTANEVLTAMQDSTLITDNMILAEVNQVNPSWEKVLFYVQVIAINEPTALAIARLKNPGSKTILHNLMLVKAQTAESVAALKYYLSKLTVNKWQGISKSKDDGNKTAVAIIKAHTHPDVADVATPGAPLNNALLIFESATGVVQANPPVALPIVNQAP